MLPRCWNVYWYEDSWFCVVEMVYGVIGLQEGYGIITDHIQRIYWWRSAYVMLQALSFDIFFMWDRGSLGESP